jgi:alkyl hydroperoxide reductase subunit AhpF
MPLLNDKIRSDIGTVLSAMGSKIRLVSFTQEFECGSCADARTLVEELASVSDKLTHEVYDLVADKAKAEELGVDKVPATVVARDGAARVRFYGIPAGYEFATLLEDIVSLSHDDSGLSEESREKLVKVDRPVHLQVLVTPT